MAGIAQLAQREVAMLQGQLADLDKKNKLAVSGKVHGRMPCQHWLHACSSTQRQVVSMQSWEHLKPQCHCKQSNMPRT